MLEKTCTACGEVKPLEIFTVDSRRPHGRASSCKTCSNLRNARARAGLPLITRTRTVLPVKDRLLAASEVDPTTGCRLWTKAKCRAGYGKLKVRGVMAKAHRVAYEEFIGPIDEGKFVCHKCDVPACIEPSHLFLGTPKDNVADMVRKGRCGRRGGGAPKLTREQRVAIKQELRRGRTFRELAVRYGVGDRAIAYTRDNEIRRPALRKAGARP